MIKAYVVSCIVIALVAYKTEKKIMNPVTLLSLMWAVIMFLASLEYYSLYEAAEKTYFWIMLGVGMYALGYYFVRVVSRNKGIHFKFGNSVNNIKLNSQSINYRTCYVLSVLCLIYIFYRMSRYGIVGASLNLAELSTIISENDGGEPGIINAISFLIINPMFIALTVVAGIDFWVGRRNKILLMLIGILTIGRIFISGGRHAIIQLFIVWIVAITFSEDKYNNYVKIKMKSTGTKKKALITLIVAGIAFLFLSMTKTNDIIKTIYLDFAMQPYMLEKWSEIIGDQYAYGFSSMFGVVHPILYVLKNLFRLLSDMPQFFADIYNMNQETFNSWIPIGTYLRANAYTSIFWYLYFDAREIGIAVGMFILGMISFNSFNIAVRTGRLVNIAKYIMIAICIMYSFTDMEFSKAYYVLAFIYLNFVFFKNDKIKGS